MFVIATYQALIVAVLALLPGASYTFALERTIGSYGINFSDRLVRFLAASAIFHALASGPEYLLYRTFLASNELSAGRVHWWTLELIAMPYVLVPIGIGALAGRLRKKGTWLGRMVVGVDLEPRAWDYLWGEKPEAIVRLKLKSEGTWLAGVFGTRQDGRRSYTSAYPTEDTDIFLATALETDPTTGALIRDTEGRPQMLEGQPGLLVRWAEVEYFEIQEFTSDQPASEPQQGDDDEQQPAGHREEGRPRELG
jgi:hypothetical protein